MSFGFPWGSMVTLISVITTDDGLGNTTEETVTYEWGPCAIAPRFATESNDPRVSPVVVGKTVYGPTLDFDPTDLRIDSDDRLVLADGEHQVDGLPEDYTGEGRSPFSGWEPGLIVQTKRVAAV